MKEVFCKLIKPLAGGCVLEFLYKKNKIQEYELIQIENKDFDDFELLMLNDLMKSVSLCHQLFGTSIYSCKLIHRR